MARSNNLTGKSCCQGELAGEWASAMRKILGENALPQANEGRIDRNYKQIAMCRKDGRFG
jgi:hypothetical protein